MLLGPQAMMWLLMTCSHLAEPSEPVIDGGQGWKHPHVVAPISHRQPRSGFKPLSPAPGTNGAPMGHVSSTVPIHCPGQSGPRIGTLLLPGSPLRN